MRTAMRRCALGASTVLAAAAMAVTLAPGSASAETIIKFYPYSTAGAQQCTADANALGGSPEYWCRLFTASNIGPLGIVLVKR